MDILKELLAQLPREVRVRNVLVGAHWTVVSSLGCGLASTILGSKPHGHDKVRFVGDMIGMNAWELAQLALSDNLLEASIGIAAINSLIQVELKPTKDVNAGDVLIELGRDKNIALVGHFPFIPRLQEIARNLWVIEQNPSPGEYPANHAPDLISQADVVAITGSAIINHTLGKLLPLARRDVPVLILGPSTPLSPILFKYGATLISGTRVINEEAVIRTVSQGATFQQVLGVQLVTLSR